MNYSLLLGIHISCVIATFVLFSWRLLLAERPRWLRVVPHVVDTLLLLSAIALMLATAQYPLVMHWLTAKLILVFVYIGLGMKALRAEAGSRGRVLWGGGALVVFAQVVGVALTHHPLGLIAPLLRLLSA